MNINQMNDLLVANVFQAYTVLANKLDAVNLAQGVPEPIMEREINQALTTALHTGWQYTSPLGLESLRIALSNEYDHEFTTDEILITSGCTESLYLGVFAASKIYGNKVAFFEPFYPYYMSLAQLLDMEAIPLGMMVQNGQILPDWQELESAIISGTKILILNTPHNPSGWVMNRDDAIYLRNLADKHGVLIIVDEAYRYYTYAADDANTAMRILYENNDNILLLGSASKLLSTTGLRIGWMLGRQNILGIAYATHLYTTYCHPGPLQQLVATIFNNRGNNWFLDIKNHYISKRDKLLTALKTIGFNCESASGGHFLLADYSSMRNDLNSDDFANYFAKEYGVMPLPANIFYRKNMPISQVRFSFSISMDTIDKAISKFRKMDPCLPH